MTCAKTKVTCVVTSPDGACFFGSNDCKNPQITCPRELGEGYEKCKSICQQEHHAEIAALKAAGDKARGGMAFVIGQVTCPSCIPALQAAGITDVQITVPLSKLTSYTPRIYTSGIIRRGDRYLCTHSVKTDLWLFAGGKPEPGESYDSCLRRELREELGIVVTEMRFHAGYLNQVQGVEWIGLFYVVDSFLHEPERLEPLKHDALAWLTVEEMRERVVKQPEMGIASFLSGL